MRVVTIFGGPGTGKTGRLAEYFVEESKKYGPDKVAFVSYTRTQVWRGKSSAGRLGNIKRKKLTKFKTIHSMSRESFGGDTEVLDDEKVGRMSVYIGNDMQSVARGIDFMRNVMSNDDAVGANRAGVASKDFQKLKRFYLKVKEGLSGDDHKMIDFSDMVENAIGGGFLVDCRAAFIDEAQDLSPLQWKAVYTFFRDVDTLYVAGDPNQALFRFSGGSSNYMFRMRSDTAIVLNQSHRCCRSVMLMAETVGQKLKYKAEIPKPADVKDGFAVFYPFPDVGKRFFNPIKSLIEQGRSVMVLANTYYQLKNMKDKLFADGELNHSFLSGKCRYRYRPEKGKKKEGFVTFSTVHQAKGLEADFVLYDASCGETGRLSDFGSEGEKWQDYWRVAYTAMTRARTMLVVCELSTPRHGFPSARELLYYSKFNFDNYRSFMREVNASARDSTP